MEEGGEWENGRTTIAIVGASARAAAFSAIRAGFTPLTADLFADADLARVANAARIENYPHGLLDWLRTTPADTPWMYTGALENYPDLVHEMASARPLIGCHGDALHRIRDPIQLAKIFATTSVNFPETIPFPQDHALLLSPPPPGRGRGSGGGGAKQLTEPFSTFLLKTYPGSSGSGVQTWDGGSPISMSRHPMYLQRRIDGIPGSAVFVAAGGESQLLGITRQLVGTSWTHSGPFQYTGSIGPWRLDPGGRDALHRAGHAVAGMGVVGLFGIDFILDANEQVWVVEVNPRYTASVEVVERMTGVAAVESHWRAAAGGALESGGEGGREGEGDRFFGKAILFAWQDLRITRAFARWSLERARSVDWPEVADLPRVDEHIPTGRPVLTLFAKGASTDEVEGRLQQRVAVVQESLLSSIEGDAS